LLKSPDVADVKSRRYRRLEDIDGQKMLVEVTDDNLAGLSRFSLDLPCDGDTRKQLVSLAPKRERPDFGTRRQRLWRHVGLVRKYARDIVERLAVSDEIDQAVKLAAAWHDHGKCRDIWQHAVGHKKGERPLGKSGGAMGRVPGGYRHEFGSLCEFIDAHEGNIPNDVFELAMHLTATHHGRGRPHFPKGGFDPLARAKCPHIAAEVIRRFARLQRKYGYWQLAYLENLLRCADAAASAENR
jgi:CRISPR-associated helicase Cas3